jgi:hypothetical protein
MKAKPPADPFGADRASASSSAAHVEAAFDELRTTVVVFSRALARGDLALLERQVPQLQASHRACVAAVAQAAGQADSADLDRMRTRLIELQRELSVQRARVAQQAAMNRPLLELLLPDMADRAAYTENLALASGVAVARRPGVARLYSASAR